MSIRPKRSRLGSRPCPAAMSNRPYDFLEARQAVTKAAKAQIEAEADRAAAVETYAGAERDYRVSLSRRIVELHDSGVAWSVAADVARGETEVAELRRVRDIAHGMLSVAENRSFRTGADRRSVDRLIEWSMKRELFESGGNG